MPSSSLTPDGAPKFSYIMSQRHSQQYVNNLLPPQEQEHQSNIAILSMSWANVTNAMGQPMFAMRAKRMAVASAKDALIVPFSRLEAIRVRVVGRVAAVAIAAVAVAIAVAFCRSGFVSVGVCAVVVAYGCLVVAL